MLVTVACQPLDSAATSDPATCEGCHPDETREWASSMHSYASEDPVFVAMNQRGQRETGGQLGTFCIACHAPFAGTTDLAQVPRENRGVGCVACHQVSAIEELHNGKLQWDIGGPMRGGLHAKHTPAHDSERSDFVDANQPTSSRTCGACHDVVVGNAVAIESTYAEWSSSVFATNLSCAGCHMFPTGPRKRDHSFPGIDVATSPWPDVAHQRDLVARDLRAALITKICTRPTGGGIAVDVTLDNAQVGHAFPSGATHARRLWVELEAATGGVVTQSIGNFDPGAVVRASQSPDVWILGSRFLRGGAEVEFAWQAEAIESNLLTPSVTIDPLAPGYYHSQTRSFVVTGHPDVIRMSLHEQPIGVDILDDLVASGDLDPAVITASPTHTLDGVTREWHSADGYSCVP